MKFALLLCLLFIGSLVLGQKPIEIYDSTIEDRMAVETDKLILIDFYATWCGPCKVMDPILEEFALEYEDQLIVYKMDVDANTFPAEVGVSAMPTYVLYRDNDVIDSFSGSREKEEMRSILVENMPQRAAASSSPSSSDIGVTYPDLASVNALYSQSNVDENWNNWQDLNSLAWQAFLNENDIRDLLVALKMAKRSIELNKNSFNTDTYAALLYKTGSLDEALNWAKIAVDLAKSEGKDPIATKHLMQLIIEAM
ncbi:MAG: hypothetical protein KTR13_05660 [Saprospiraceae bacterium]|nr:hypothetical protein [Saprospiraceae bacterium]